MRSFRLSSPKSAIPGYTETRRHLLLATPAVLAGLIASPRRLLAALDEAQTDTALDAFILASEARAMALKAEQSAAGQDTYVNYLADAVARIGGVSREGIAGTSWKGFEPGVYLGINGRNRAFFVVNYELEPRAFLPPHCHPKTSVCTLGIQGSATVRHFDIPVDAPDYRSDHNTEFLIRQTRQVALAAGTTSTLTEHRDNIHLFQAGDGGARFIDITTDYGGDGSFSFVGMDPGTATGPGGNYYVARWLGTDI